MSGSGTDQIRTQLMTIFAVKGDSDSSMFTLIWAMVMLSVFEHMAKIMPTVIAWCGSALSARAKRHIKIPAVMKKSSSRIVFERHYAARSGDNLADAVLDYICRQDSARELIFNDFYLASNADTFALTPEINVRIINKTFKEGKIDLMIFEIFSENLTLFKLKKWVSNVNTEYEAEKKNKFGEKRFFFDEHIIVQHSRGMPTMPHMIFSMTEFHTNKSLGNTYGEHIQTVRDRVDLFIHQPQWYEEKGIPHTLGLLLHGPPGTGKCLARDTPILMYNGDVRAVQTLRTGELLMGDDSTPRVIMSTCTGRETMYKVTQTHGTSYTVNESHILSLKLIESPRVIHYPDRHEFTVHWFKMEGVQTSVYKYDNSNGRDTVFAQVKEFIETLPSKGTVIDVSVIDYISRTEEWKSAYGGYKTGVEYNKRDVLGCPYILGSWLIDGDEDKDVPKEYALNDRTTRLELLAGLIDHGGHLADTNCFGIVHKHKRLSYSILSLAQSLGFRASLTEGDDGTCYNVRISGHLDELPTKLPRNQVKPLASMEDPLVCGISLTKLEEDEYYGFEINGNKRFILGDYTVTHNTSLIKALAKDTKRHIFNIKLNKNTTQAQMNDLFYNENVNLKSDNGSGMSGCVTIPLNQRIYVMEDIDCLGDVVIDRAILESAPSPTSDVTGNREDDGSWETEGDLTNMNTELPTYTSNPKGARDGSGYAQMRSGYGSISDMRPVASTMDKASAMMAQRDGNDQEEVSSDLTLSFLLNLFDGVLETPGRILIMTSNFPDRLDRALIRPGRVDINLELGYCTDNLVMEMYRGFFGEEREFTGMTKLELTPARVQEILCNNFNDPEAAYEGINVLADTQIDQ